MPEPRQKPVAGRSRKKTTANRFRIFLADDHAVLRDGLRLVINSQPDMTVVGEASNGRETIRKVRQLRPDILVLDVSMPDHNGVEATRELVRDCPGTKILALTVHESADYLTQLLTAGAAGFVVKRSAADVLLSAIRRVARGGVHFDPDLMHQTVSRFLQDDRKETSTPSAALSRRETEVLRLLGQGHTAKEAAAHLNISIKSIETYKARVMEKLDLTSRVDLVRCAHARGLLSNP
jgi:two-component system, NarL family, response regulator NreC